jgi:hypothetical protein
MQIFAKGGATPVPCGDGTDSKPKANKQDKGLLHVRESIYTCEQQATVMRGMQRVSKQEENPRTAEKAQDAVR